MGGDDCYHCLWSILLFTGGPFNSKEFMHVVPFASSVAYRGEGEINTFMAV
jgi:hypothetical protein